MAAPRNSARSVAIMASSAVIHRSMATPREYSSRQSSARSWLVAIPSLAASVCRKIAKMLLHRRTHRSL